MRRDRLPYLLIPVAALIAILPLILQGPSCGHDFTFHLLNWFEAAAQFRHGTLHPQWAFSPAWNAGEPRFVFYPPLSWTLGALLGLILPWTWTPIVYTWFALSASGLAMHRLARAHATPTAALLAATLYLANPYMLFTAYERTAYAELLAAALLPLLVHAILRPKPTIPAIAIPLALLWLTNAPAAVMGTYTLALLALIRLLTPLVLSSFRNAGGPASRLARTTFAGTVLGLSLAAFYILPAATERPLVRIAMVIIPGMRADDNTLFHHTGITEDALAHDAVLHTASLIALILLTLTAILLTQIRNPESFPTTSIPRPPSSRLSPSYPFQSLLSHPVSLPLTILTATIALLLTPISLPVWHHAPELAFLQFPWRLLAVQAVALSLATALALDRLLAPRRHPEPSETPQPLPLPVSRRHPERSKGPLYLPSTILPTIASLALAATLTFAATPFFRQPCDPEDTIPARMLAFQTHQGSEPTDEYTPADADNDSLHPHDPPFWLSPDPDAPPPPTTTPGRVPEDFTLTSPVSQQLILNLRQYPAWHITLDAREVPPATLTQTPRSDGLINLPIPSGPTHVHIAYRSTPLERAAAILTALALLALGVLLFLTRYARPAHTPPLDTPATLGSGRDVAARPSAGLPNLKDQSEDRI